MTSEEARQGAGKEARLFRFKCECIGSVLTWGDRKMVSVANESA